MRRLLIIAVLFTTEIACSQSNVQISTLDITHFWEAYDSLPFSKDAEATLQRLYIDRATPGFKDFIKARNFTAAEYVRLIKRYPKFWTSIRPNTLSIIQRQKELEDIFDKFRQRYPDFKAPGVCFAIGCLRTGGTTTRSQILIGSEIAGATATTDKSEMTGWLKMVVGSTGDIVAMVAHEAVHTQQKVTFAYARQYLGSRLLAQSVREGAADFVSMEIAHTTINQPIYDYGNANIELLKKEFKAEMNQNDMKKWLYNGSQQMDRPADLGYFMGYKISEAYYQNAKNKPRALKQLMHTRNPKKILRRSNLFQ